jgi:tRNA1Val (adenine37-N6)-methyltransferase
MANSYFQFKKFIIYQDRCAMKVTTDGCLFGAWVAERVVSRQSLVMSPSAAIGMPTAMRVSLVPMMLDIGAGTGLLSLMIAQKNNLTIDAIESDKDAFEQACENIKASPWSDRINLVHEDAKVVEFRYPYDIIISNPPFYENELKGGNIKKNLAHHNEGLLLHELLTIIKKNLKPDGVFFLLLPFKRNAEIIKLLTEQEFIIQQMVFVRQSVNHDYFRMMLAAKIKTGEAVETKIDEISIKNGTDQYSADFIKLLKDYYLHL